MTTKAEREKAKEEEEAEAVADAAQETPPTGPTLTPDEPRPVEAATLVEAGEPEANPNVVDDGVEDIELGPPAVGQFVQILTGDYTGHFAVYLGNVMYDDHGRPSTIQVRTRDADNVLLDVAYKDVSSTAYSGGR
jgi:hypothetical protein